MEGLSRRFGAFNRTRVECKSDFNTQTLLYSEPLIELE